MSTHPLWLALNRKIGNLKSLYDFSRPRQNIRRNRQTELLRRLRRRLSQVSFVRLSMTQLDSLTPGRCQLQIRSVVALNFTSSQMWFRNRCMSCLGTSREKMAA